MMPVNTEAIGKTWPSASFEVEAARIDSYANAVGEDNPLYHDAAAAKAAGFRDLVAPPMFCVVYSAPAMGPAGCGDCCGRGSLRRSRTRDLGRLALSLTRP